MELYLNTAWRPCQALGGPQLRPSPRTQQSSLLHLPIAQRGSTANWDGGAEVVGLAGNHRHPPPLPRLTLHTPHPEEMQQDSLETGFHAFHFGSLLFSSSETRLTTSTFNLCKKTNQRAARVNR